MEVGDHMKPRLWSLRDLHHMVDILRFFGCCYFLFCLTVDLCPDGTFPTLDSQP